jgi:hypothetical protein
VKSPPYILMAYCTAAEVAALAGTWTENGEFLDADYDTEATNPSLTTVEGWIDSVSSQMDLSLGQHWFSTPVKVTAAAAYKSISLYVRRVVADLVAESHGQGRFSTDAYTIRGASPQSTILREMKEWVNENADGFLSSGLTQLTKTAKKNSIRMSSLWKEPDQWR